MTPFSKIFVPTRNRRLNELVGLLFCVSALLLFLALASYSPLDPSLNSASILTGSHAARNWIGIFGAYLSDLILQFWGVGSFLLPIFMGMLGMRWFRSRAVQTPIAKTLARSGCSCSCPHCSLSCPCTCAGWGPFPSKAWLAASSAMF